MLRSSLKKLIAEDIRSNDELRKVLSKDGIEKIKKYDELSSQIRSLGGSLSAKTIVGTDENYRPCVYVTYKCEIPVQKVLIDDKGEFIAPEIFRSINLLGILDSKSTSQTCESLKKLKQQTGVQKKK